MTTTRRIDEILESMIVDLLIGSDSTPAAIHRKVSAEGWEVSTRTVERMAKEYRAPDESPPWTVEDSDPEDAKLILAWLANIIEGGFVVYRQDRRLTKAEAFWYLQIRRIAPDLSFVRAGIVANLYRIRAAKEASTEELDAYLGFAPWRGAEALERYKEMVGAGWVKPITMWDSMVEQVSPWGAIEAKDLGWPEPQTAQELAQAAQQEEGTT
mgnify:CR=1 FL=1